MSGSAEVEDDDAIMTRDAGASRTFRSIFGDSASQDGQQDELKLQRFSRHGSGGALVGDSNGYRDSGDADEDDDDDDGVWSDDTAPPKDRGNSDEDSCEICEDDDDNNNGDERIVSDSVAEQEENAGFNSDASVPRVEELKIPHRRSMEEWADDDDEEDTWKDMLQAKVNQLELVIQNSNEATAASSSSAASQMAPAAATGTSTQLELAHHIKSRTALAAATHTVSLRGTADRPANRNKIQRTSGAQPHVSGDHSHHRHGTGGGGVHASAASTVSSPSNYLRKRSGSRDFVSSRTSRSTDAKKSAKVSSGSGRRESMTRSSSASSISSTHSRSSHAAQRKNSLDACSVGSHSRSTANGSLDALGSSTSGATKAPEPIRHVSDAEAVRRFILHDIKQMSMDRIVADAKRLRYLEDFYQQKHAEEQEKAARDDHEDDENAVVVPAETPSTD